MRIVYIGCVESSKVFLDTLLTIAEAEIVGIITKHKSKFNSDFVSLESIAQEHNIPCFIQDSNNRDEMAKWVQRLNADIIYCFGWSFLLPESIIRLTKLGAIGYHPAMLPANRGRHPIIWALVLGLKQTGSSFFFLEKYADTGDIISQKPVDIHDEDTAETLYKKLMIVGVNQVKTFTKQLAMGCCKRIPQDNSKANAWRKRGYKDGLIDWRMSARSIYNLVRALTHPYVGASFILNDIEIKVWKSRIASDYTEAFNIEPGKVIAVSGDNYMIQCGQGIIELMQCDIPAIKEGDYLI